LKAKDHAGIPEFRDRNRKKRSTRSVRKVYSNFLLLLLLLLLFLFLLRPHIAVHDVLFVAGLGFLAKVFNRRQLYLADMLPEAKPEPISVRMARQRTLDHPEIHEHISVPVSGGDVKVGVQTVFDAVYLDVVIVEHQF
jgi:hypothetical protein